MFFRFADGNGFSQPIFTTHEKADFQFVIQSPGRPEFWLRVALACLAGGTLDRRSRWNQRRRAPVIANRNVLVIRQQRVVGAEQPPYIRGVEDGRIEIRVVADGCGQKHVHIRLRDEMPRSGSPIGSGRVVAQDRMKTLSQSSPGSGCPVPSGHSANWRRKHPPRAADYRRHDPQPASPRFAARRGRECGLRSQPPLLPRHQHRVAEKLQMANSESENPSRRRWRIQPSFALRNRGSRRERVS